MNRRGQGFALAASVRFPVLTLQIFRATVLACLSLLLSIPWVHSQEAWTEPRAVYSVSGQFVVAAIPGESPLLHRADLAGDANLVRLEPALLAVSAERFKAALWSQLGFKPGGAGSGKIFLTLHPARSTNDEVTINIGPLQNVWNYRVELPDVVTRLRYARALTATLLLEIANRENRVAEHSAELPPWLTDGLAGQMLGGGSSKIILSSPAKKTDGLALARTDTKESGLDALASTRRVLQAAPALTFDQLCWPTDAQMNGADGGAYLASAHLFVTSLLALNQGPEKMRILLARLPGGMNWQTAFFAAFHQNFTRPLDVEKWWDLRIVRFTERDPGPRWTPAASREHLADLLAVPVEFRNDVNALPEHTVVSLQQVIRNFSPAQLDPILAIKRRDFELAQFRMAQPFAALADGYRAAITDFLGDSKKYSWPVFTGRNMSTVPMRRGASVAQTVQKLDALDARRRDAESKMDSNPLPKL